jgi:hypothetical protein
VNVQTADRLLTQHALIYASGRKEAKKNSSSTSEAPEKPNDYVFPIPLSLSPQPLHIQRFWTLITIDHLIGYPFPFVQGFVALAHNAGMVDKNILSRLLGDKPISSLVIEPFDFPTGHKLFPSMSKFLRTGVKR